MNLDAVFAWQLVFVSLAIVILLLEIIHGWRLGLMRQLVRLLAIVAAYASAFFLARAAAPLLRPWFKMPDPVLGIIAGAIVGVLVFVFLNIVGASLFKKTSQHQSRPLRWLWGGCGAALGLVLGAIALWLTFTGIRLIGAVAEAKVRSQSTLSVGVLQPIWNRPLQLAGAPAPAPSPADPLLAMLARMKGALETGNVGSLITTVDPLPPTLYGTLEKLGEVASNVQSAERFLSFPDARELAEHPRIVALRNDPQVAQLISRGQFLELVQNQRVIDALNDPTLQNRLKHFDLDAALDYALRRNQ